LSNKITLETYLAKFSFLIIGQFFIGVPISYFCSSIFGFIFLKKDCFVFKNSLSYGNSFFLLFILWQPKIKAQKYEIGTPMKNCP